MYKYNDFDHQMIADRVQQYRRQTERYLAGELSDDEFRPLRLQNGLYIQRIAPMLRVAVPYGLLSSVQLRKLAHIAREYDRGYVHFSTRQNVQYNWPQLEQVPDILDELARVEMHAVQTSGACIRNTTSDQFAGVARDEIEDPRPWAEIIRQWSTFHPEFAYLPRKFKIAVNAAEHDRAAVKVHDIGVELVHNAAGQLGFRIYVGGGLGRTPIIGEEICSFLEPVELLNYLEAIIRVYNLLGRRDNLYKARIKILVKAMGIDAFRAKVDAEWAHLKGGPNTLTQQYIDDIKSYFAPPAYQTIDDAEAEATLAQLTATNKAFGNWLQRNTVAHKQPGYAAVNLSLKRAGIPPGDATDAQLDGIADLADKYSFGEVRATHNQNVVLADVKKTDLFAVWEAVRKLGFATPNIGHLTDIICCPGGDYCSLANAKSIPVADAIQRAFDDLDYLYDLGPIDLNISGCMNACGHHHVGNIGILGVDKKGEEWYQIQLGGNAGTDASLGDILGPSFSRAEVTNVIGKLLQVYVDNRHEDEHFLATYRRIGIEPFKERVYAKAD